MFASACPALSRNLRLIFALLLVMAAPNPSVFLSRHVHGLFSSSAQHTYGHRLRPSGAESEPYSSADGVRTYICPGSRWPGHLEFAVQLCLYTCTLRLDRLSS